MPTLSITRSVTNGTVFTQAQNETQCSDVETWANSTKLDSTNIQAGGIATSNLASASVDSSKLATSAVATANIADGAVTGVKLNSAIVDNSTIGLTANQLLVKTSGIGTTQIADAAVTKAKQATMSMSAATATAGNVAISASSGAFSSASTVYVDVTNLSVTLTTTGRPVMISMIPDPAAVGGGVNSTYVFNAANSNANIRLYRDATAIAESLLSQASGTNYYNASCPIMSIDAPAAGTYTYKVQYKASTAVTSQIYYWKLIAFEL